MFFNQYPYININDLNLDYILRKLKEIEINLKDFIKINTIKYANPIQWNITTQYEANTVVIDANTGTAYLSVAPVPSGIALTNTDYWTVIFTLDIVSANQNITFRNDGANVLATFDSAVDDWLLWGSVLYKVIRPITTNEAYVVGYNIERYTVELFIKDYITQITNIIGDITDLDTTDKTDLVAAINEVVDNIGDLTNLTTTDKTNLVAAINELKSLIDAIPGSLIVTAEEFGAVGDGVTDDASAIQNAINNADIVILNRDYYISTPLNVGKGKTLKGYGTIRTNVRNNMIVLNGDNVVKGLKFTDTLSYDASSGYWFYALDGSNFEISGCTFDTVGEGACICFEHCDHINISNNKFNDYGHTGIKMLGTCSYFAIEFNDLNNARYTGDQHNYPITISGYTTYDHGVAHHIKCNYNTITQYDNEWEGIDSHGASFYEIIGNKITGCRVGIVCDNQRTSSQSYFLDANQNSRIEDNSIVVAGVNACGIRVSQDDVNATSENLSILGNYINVNADASSATTAVVSAITIRPTGLFSSCQIKNNTFRCNNAHGVSLDGLFYNIDMDSNYFARYNSPNHYMFNLTAIDHFNGIRIRNNTVSSAVSGQVFFNGSSVVGYNNDLVVTENNNVGSNTYSNITYATAPRSAMATATKNNGRSGMFIENSDTTSTVIGWNCKGAGHWYSVTGTSV